MGQPVAKVIKLGRGGEESPRASIHGIADADLVGQVLEGDRRAQSTLIRRHAGQVSAVVARLLGTTEGVEDIVHDAMIAAFQDLEALTDRGAFRGWLTRIAVHRTHNVLRRCKLERRLGLRRGWPDATLEILADDGLGPEDRAQLAEIDEILERLSTKLRISWILHHVEGYSLKEVSTLCRCSLTTTKRRVKAAHRAILEGVLEAPGGGP